MYLMCNLKNVDSPFFSLRITVTYKLLVFFKIKEYIVYILYD